MRREAAVVITYFVKQAYIFRKAGCRPITIPKHEPIKKVYVELVKKVVESEAGNDENVG